MSFGAEVAVLRSLFDNMAQGSGATTSPPTSSGGGGGGGGSAECAVGNVVLELARVIGTILLGEPILLEGITPYSMVTFDTFLQIVDELRTSVFEAHATRSASDTASSSSSLLRGHFAALSRSELGSAGGKRDGDKKGVSEEQMLRLVMSQQRLQITERDHVIDQLHREVADSKRETQDLA
jgi:hypothetical protein